MLNFQYLAYTRMQHRRHLLVHLLRAHQADAQRHKQILDSSKWLPNDEAKLLRLASSE
jgi:hypothetical protein